MTAVLYHTGRFPPKDLNWADLIPLIGPANAALARYEGVLQGVHNPNILLSPMTTQEAVLSSRIEGTQTTLGELLEFEAKGEVNDESTPEKQDIKEIINYRFALVEAISLLNRLPLSERLIRLTHEKLMQGVRGRNKAPGEYRKIPNWIGPAGCTVDEANFVPIDASKLPEAMTTWENYLNSDQPDKLVQLAIVHAEFEALHPFLDGNGRLGRLIIPLFLYDKDMLSYPNFYLSEYLEDNREEYYTRLSCVSSKDDWTGWCKFFLKALIEQAEVNQRKAMSILELYGDKKKWITDVTHSQYAVRALDQFFNKPIFSSSDFIEMTEIPKPTAQRILREARDRKLLKELLPARGRRPAVLAFSELLNIAEGRNAF